MITVLQSLSRKFACRNFVATKQDFDGRSLRKYTVSSTVSSNTNKKRVIITDKPRTRFHAQNIRYFYDRKFIANRLAFRLSLSPLQPFSDLHRFFGNSECIVAYCSHKQFVQKAKHTASSSGSAAKFPPIDRVNASDTKSMTALSDLALLIAQTDKILFLTEASRQGQLHADDMLTFFTKKQQMKIPDERVNRVWIHTNDTEALREAVKSVHLKLNSQFTHLGQSLEYSQLFDWYITYNISTLAKQHLSEFGQVIATRWTLPLLNSLVTYEIKAKAAKTLQIYSASLPIKAGPSDVITFHWVTNCADSPASPHSLLSQHITFSEDSDILLNFNLKQGESSFDKLLQYSSSDLESTDSSKVCDFASVSREESFEITASTKLVFYHPAPLLPNLSRYKEMKVSADILASLYDEQAITAHYSLTGRIPASCRNQVISTLQSLLHTRKASDIQAEIRIALERLRSEKWLQNCPVFDPEMKDDDLHAVIPFVHIVGAGGSSKHDAYNVILRAFVTAFMPPVVYEVITVDAASQSGHTIRSSAIKLISSGWQFTTELRNSKFEHFRRLTSRRYNIHLPTSLDAQLQTELFDLLSSFQVGQRLEPSAKAELHNSSWSPPPINNDFATVYFRGLAQMWHQEHPNSSDLGIEFDTHHWITDFFQRHWIRNSGERWISDKGYAMVRFFRPYNFVLPSWAIHFSELEYQIASAQTTFEEAHSRGKRTLSIALTPLLEHKIEHLPQMPRSWITDSFHPSAHAHSSLDSLPCPKCHHIGTIVDSLRAYYCTNFECDWILPSQIGVVHVHLDDLHSLITSGFADLGEDRVKLSLNPVTYDVKVLSEGALPPKVPKKQKPHNKPKMQPKPSD